MRLLILGQGDRLNACAVTYQFWDYSSYRRTAKNGDVPYETMSLKRRWKGDGDKKILQDCCLCFGSKGLLLQGCHQHRQLIVLSLGPLQSLT